MVKAEHGGGGGGRVSLTFIRCSPQSFHLTQRDCGPIEAIKGRGKTSLTIRHC